MLTLEKFEEASELVKRVTNPTKLIYSDYLSEQSGGRVYLKPENMQHTGAYKIRGAYYKISTLSEEERERGLITASAGNHAQGVAFAAKKFGCKATIVMPTVTPLIKVNRTKSYGAEVVLHGDVYDDAYAYACELAEKNGYTFVHPFNDLDVATGQGTIAMEIVQELPTVDYILVPVGGGGLITGVSTLAKMLNPKIKVIGVEPAEAASMTAALQAGEVVELDSANTIADGTAVKAVGDKILPYVQENVDDVLLAEDDELIGAFLDMVENHKLLNDLCHKLDATRPTTMAHAFMLDMDDPFVMASDIRSYNLYYGWYLGELEQNDQFFDEFHQKHPEAVIGLSEYGADANPVYQNGHPEKGDWSEPYQAIYHEHMLKMWSERPYIWAMHCWNMFDFAADGRNEGGKPGQNQKGLVTFDRRTKKDAFYIYKAYLSKEPFVHICGRRYADRPEAVTEVKVYSNQPAVTLLVDSREFATQTGDKIFKFQVPITGAHTIEARSGELSDTIAIRKVDKPNPAYSVTGGEVVNWFDRPDELERAGYYSILDSMEGIKQSPAGAALLARMMAKVTASYGDVAKSVTLPAAVQRQMDKMPLQSLLKQAGKAVTPEMAQRLNNALNQIPRVS